MTVISNIWIWGDSWAVPNYTNHQQYHRARYHTSELLCDFGYSVHNMAMNGYGNGSSIIKAEYLLDNVMQQRHPTDHADPAWIIWFHTSIIRDLAASGQDHQHDYDQVSADFYQRAAVILRRTGAKLIVIEGHAPVWEQTFFQYLDPDLLIRNWRGHILGMPDLPQSHWYKEYDKLQAYLSMTAEQKHHEIDKIDCFTKITNESQLFVDNTHPGDRAHISLTLTLLDFLEQNKVPDSKLFQCKRVDDH